MDKVITAKTKNRAALIFDRSALKSAVSLLCRVAPKRATIPALTHVRVSSNGDGFVALQTTNLEVALSIRLPKSGDGDVVGMIPVDRLLKYLRQTKGTERISALIDEGSNCTSVTLDENMKLAGCDPDDFPSRLVGAPEKAVRLGQFYADELVRALRSVLYAVSVDTVRYALTGVCFQPLEEGRLDLAASDGARLAVARMGHIPGAKKDWRMVVQGAVCDLLVDLCKAAPGEVVSLDGAAGDEGGAEFTVGNATLGFKPVEGTFPDYEGVIPDCKDEDRWTFDAETLRAALKQAMLAVTDGKNHRVDLSLSPDSCALSSKQQDVGESHGTATCEGTGRLKVSVDAKFVIEYLAGLPLERLRVTLHRAKTHEALLWTAEGVPHRFVQAPMTG